jgi:hypothetical protein
MEEKLKIEVIAKRLQIIIITNAKKVDYIRLINQ